MATNSIASASLVLTANNQQLTQGLNQASQQISSFSQKAGEGITYVGAAFTGFITAQLTGYYDDFKNKFKEIATNLKESAKEAKALGVSLAFVQSVKGLGGIDSGSFLGGMAKFEQHIAQAVEGSKEMQANFAKVGISVKDLNTTDVQTLWGMFSESLKNMGDPAERMAAAMGLAGKSAKEIMPLLLKGSEGMKEMQDKAWQMGLITTKDQTEQIEKFNKATKEASKSVEGLWTQLTALKASAEISEKTAGAFQDLTNRLRFIENEQAGMGFWNRLSMAVLPGIYQIPQQKKPEGTDKDEVINRAKIAAFALAQDMKALEEEVFKTGQTFGYTAQEIKVFDLIARGANVKDFKKIFEEMNKNDMRAVVQEMDKLNESLEQQIATWGMAGDNVKLYEMRMKALKTGVAMDDFDKGMKDAQTKLDQLTGKKLTEEANPVIGLERGLRELDRLLDAGAINWLTYHSAVQKAMKAAEDAYGVGGEPKLPSAMMRGSREALEFSLKEQFRGSIEPQNQKERWQRLIEEQKNIQHQQLEVQRKLLDEAKKKNEPIIEKVL